jgi:hypothetical protein
MKRYLASAFGVAIFFLLAFGLQPLKGQVWGDFEKQVVIVPNAPYVDIDNMGSLPINPSYFIAPDNGLTDRDDGYYILNFQPSWNFQFEFDGQVYDKVWVSTNGFITFTAPPLYKTKDPNRLFTANADLPWNVVAPFWGDHYLRIQQEVINGFRQGSISYLYDNTEGCLTIQWHNLNVNYPIYDNEGIYKEPNKESYADFQVKLYKSVIAYTAQGKIQFCYGQATGLNVKVQGSSIGLRGESGDFVNGLVYEGNPYGLYYTQNKVSTILTDRWQPSGGTEKRIQFNVIPRFYVENILDPYLSWGDGDADLSQGIGQKHYTMPQMRYVTINDVLTIMRSQSTWLPLDPVRRRQGYHGDVNHNGRYYYEPDGKRTNIPYRDSLYTDHIQVPAAGINAPSPKSVRYEANEYDAALILHYISGRLTGLPWLIDSVPMHGKISDLEYANALRFGKVTSLDNDLYQVPVYLNGYFQGPIGSKFELNGKVINVENLCNDNQNLQITNGNNIVVIAGDGSFDCTLPIFNLTFEASSNQLQINNMRFNDKECPGLNLSLTGIEETNDLSLMLQNAPNPFFGKTVISFNVIEAGNYTLTVYDLSGNRVKSLVNNSLTPGSYTFNWDGTDETGNSLESGMYIYRLIGDGISISKKLVISK